MKRLHTLFLCIILIATGFLRLYAFDSSIQFDSDFGRDSLFAVRLLTEKPSLLGAQASVGGFYLGPLYFYFIAVLFKIFGYVPQIISLSFAAMNMLAAYLIYRLLSKKVSLSAGFIGAVLFAFNPLLISASRGATHQPMLPLLTVLSVMSLIWALEKISLKRLFISGLVFGLFFHVHFSSLLFVPGFLALVFLYGDGPIQKKFLHVYAVMLGMLLMLSPLILFDVRHHFITSQAFFKYLIDSATGKAITANFPHWTLVQKIQHIGRFIAPAPVMAVCIVMWALFNKKSVSLSRATMIILGSFLSVALFLLLYKGYLFTYYLIIPCTLGILAVSAYVGRASNIFVSWVFVGMVVLGSVQYITPLYQPTFRTITNLSQIVHAIETHVNATGQRNFAIFKDSADGMTGLAYEYRFLLQRDGYIPQHELSYSQANALYVIREDGSSDPVTLGNVEVAQFGPKNSTEIAQYEILGKNISVFVLTK